MYKQNNGLYVLRQLNQPNQHILHVYREIFPHINFAAFCVGGYFRQVRLCYGDKIEQKNTQCSSIEKNYWGTFGGGGYKQI